MENDKPLIWVKKIIQRQGHPVVIEDDIVRKSDIKRIRRWHKNDLDKDIEGEIVQITIQGSNGFPAITVKVSESLESLSKRLGIVHEVNR